MSAKDAQGRQGTLRSTCGPLWDRSVSASLTRRGTHLQTLLRARRSAVHRVTRCGHLLSRQITTCTSRVGQLGTLITGLRHVRFNGDSRGLHTGARQRVRRTRRQVDTLRRRVTRALNRRCSPMLPSTLHRSSTHGPLPTSLPHRAQIVQPRRRYYPTYNNRLDSLKYSISRRLRLVDDTFGIVRARHPGRTYYQYSRVIRTPMPSGPVTHDCTKTKLLTRIIAKGCTSRLPLCHRSRVCHHRKISLDHTALKH